MENNPQLDSWLLLRGLGRNHAHWGDFIVHLKEAFPNTVIFAIDLPGVGRFNQIPSPTSIEEIAVFVKKQYLEQLKVYERSGKVFRNHYALGISMGAMVLWDLLIKSELSFSHSVLINTSLSSFSPFYHRLRWQNFSDYAALFISNNVVMRENRIFDLTSLKPEIKKETLRQWLEITRLYPTKKETWLKQLCAASRFKPTKIPQDKKVLLLCSEKDKLVSNQCTKDIHIKTNFKMVVHPSAGHDLPLDDPQWIVQEIKQYLSLPL